MTITDNAAPRENLLVYATAGARPVRSIPVLPDVPSGTENSSIGFDRSVVVASAYGYPYPVVPDGAGESEPRTAPFTGGMTKVDIRPDGSGCDVRWRNDVRSAAVPRLSGAEGTICTTTRESSGGGDRAGLFDRFALTAIDAETGSARGDHLGAGFFSTSWRWSASSHPTGCSTRAPSPASCASGPPPEAEHACPARPRTGSVGTPRSSGQENPP